MTDTMLSLEDFGVLDVSSVQNLEYFIENQGNILLTWLEFVDFVNLFKKQFILLILYIILFISNSPISTLILMFFFPAYLLPVVCSYLYKMLMCIRKLLIWDHSYFWIGTQYCTLLVPFSLCPIGFGTTYFHFPSILELLNFPFQFLPWPSYES